MPDLCFPDRLITALAADKSENYSTIQSLRLPHSGTLSNSGLSPLCGNNHEIGVITPNRRILTSVLDLFYGTPHRTQHKKHIIDNNLSHLIAQYKQAQPNDTDVDSFLRFMRQHGCSKIQSIKALMISREIGLGEAKKVVHLSPAWRDRRTSDDSFHAQLEKISQALADKDTFE